MQNSQVLRTTFHAVTWKEQERVKCKCNLADLIVSPHFRKQSLRQGNKRLGPPPTHCSWVVFLSLPGRKGEGARVGNFLWSGLSTKRSFLTSDSTRWPWSDLARNLCWFHIYVSTLEVMLSSLTHKRYLVGKKCFLKFYVFEFFIWKAEGAAREREREKKDLSIGLFHNAYNSQDWARVKPGAKNCIRVSHK